MFFDARKYDFSRVGRLKFNIKLDLSTPLEKRILEPADFYAVITLPAEAPKEYRTGG